MKLDIGYIRDNLLVPQGKGYDNLLVEQFILDNTRCYIIETDDGHHIAFCFQMQNNCPYNFSVFYLHE